MCAASSAQEGFRPTRAHATGEQRACTVLAVPVEHTERLVNDSPMPVCALPPPICHCGEAVRRVGWVCCKGVPEAAGLANK